MSITEMVLSYLRVLVWPALVFALAIAFRSTIRSLLKVRLRQIDAAGFSAKFEEVAQDAERVVEADRPASPTTPTPLNPAGAVRMSPRSYQGVRAVGETYRSGKPVLLDLSKMPDYDAKRVVDFAAGMIFSAHGRIDRIAERQFVLTPGGSGAQIRLATATPRPDV